MGPASAGNAEPLGFFSRFRALWGGPGTSHPPGQEKDSAAGELADRFVGLHLSSDQVRVAGTTLPNSIGSMVHDRMAQGYQRQVINKTVSDVVQAKAGEVLAEAYTLAHAEAPEPSGEIDWIA